MGLNKHNVLLMEKQSIMTNNIINDNENKTVNIKGYRIFRIVKPIKKGYMTIAQYDHNTDFTDLSKLHDYKNYYLCSVDIDAYSKNKLVWNCCKLLNGADDSTIFNIIEARQCTPEEVKVLDEVFVDFYNEADKIFKAKLKLIENKNKAEMPN